MNKNRNIILSREEVMKEKPQDCWFCQSDQVKYWDETDEEVIFKCQECGRYMPLSFDKNPTRIKLYLFC